MHPQKAINHFPEKLSVVIPAYNEVKRISGALAICKKWQQRFPGWEFIFVNDGSTDETAKAITGFKVISYQANKGKGYALKMGVAKATKPLVLICDIDFSTPLKELGLLYPFILNGADVAIGSRKVTGAKVLKHQSPIREWLGKQFTNLSKLWLGLTVSDVTCGFKLFKTPAAKKLFAASRISRWGYDAEILFLAKKFNFKVADAPVTWTNDERTKVNMARDVFNSLCDLFLIRWHDRLGRY